MKADKLPILKKLIGQPETLFKIPVYQRNYDWVKDNCTKLLSDIEEIIGTNKRHFIGAIVYMSDNDTLSLSEYIIIDGQQRLTTMMILLKALADIAHDENNIECEQRINETYLRNRFCEEEFKVKLKPIKSDNEQFLLLLNNSDEINKNSRIYMNYEICKTTMSKWIKKGISVKDILEALDKLEAVGIALTKGEDDPQIIFESINSTGLDLTSSDLIRNFLLMNTEEQDKLYDQYWLYIENKLKKENDYEWLNKFFTQYLVFKLSRPIINKKIYESFVSLYKDKNYTQEKILEELKYYSDIFANFVYKNEDYSKSIGQSLHGLRELKQTTCYPFLLHIFDDYEQERINEEVLNKTLKLILSYLLIRVVCGRKTNTLDKLFCNLYNRIFKVPENKNKYYESINKFLFSLKRDDAFPSKQEFEDQLKRVRLYNMKYLCKYLLGEIENQDGKEVIDISKLSVEHIMPQKLSADWNEISNEDHEKYVHTLGNLTLTGYNPKLSNKSFEEKKKILQENSKIKELNKDVTNQEEWNIETIQTRAERLTKIISDRYYPEQIKDDSINLEDIEYIKEISLSDDDIESVTNTTPVSFTFNGETHRESKFITILQVMLKLLDEIDKLVIPQLANKNFSGLLSQGERTLRKPWHFRDGIYLERNLSAAKIMRFLKEIIGEFDIDESSFCLKVKDNQSTDDINDEADEENE